LLLGEKKRKQKRDVDVYIARAKERTATQDLCIQMAWINEFMCAPIEYSIDKTKEENL
jgi:hypothetical protein